MIKPEQIPDEVCLGLLHALLGNPQPTPQTVRAAIAAALNAWPDMVERFFPNDPTRAPGVFLPLPKEGD